MLLIPATISTMWALVADPLHTALTSGALWLATFARAAAPEAVAALWQGASIAFVLGICLRFTPRIHVYLGAAQRFVVWAVAFVTIAVLPFLPSVPLRASFGYGAIVPSVTASPAQSLHFPFVQIGDRWALGLAALWLVASLVRAAGLIWHSFSLHKLWKSATPVVGDENLHGLLAAVSSARRQIELCTTRDLDRPSVIGFFAPRILIPEWLFRRLTAGELEHVVLHEAEHLHRGDDWINLLQKLALVLFPLNPALAWIERRLCREREMACDEGVVRRTQSPQAYAASLANVAGHAIARRHAHALSLGAFERRSELARRVASLLARKPTLHPAAARALVGVAACGLLAVSLELARCPQMVAFVPTAPAANVAQINLPAMQDQGDRVFRQPVAASSISGFRAITAKAILAPNQVSSHHAYGTASAGAKAPNPMSTSYGPAKAVPLLQNMPRRSSTAISSLAEGKSSRQDLVAQQESNSSRQIQFAAQPQVVVFTAWEEIETRSSGPVADYDPSVTQSDSTESRTGVQNSRRQRPSVQITVTRLIFWVAPRQVTSNPAPGSKSPRPTSFDSRQLPAPTAESGWLVFQL